MQITLEDKGQPIGPFTLDQVREKIAAGQYPIHGLAWYEGAPAWMPLSSVPGIDLGSAAFFPGGISQPQTSVLAIWSLVLGILSFMCLVTGIPAVICGHLALGNIKKSGGALTGGGLAIAGLITGYVGTLLIGVAFVAGLTAPMVIRQKKKADQTEAISNARSLGYALLEFKAEYGDFPTDATAVKVAEAMDLPKVSGNSSNARFRQLFQANVTQSEVMFYSKSDGCRKPDNFITGESALAKGECGFAFVGNLDAKDETPRPLAMTPMVPGTHHFDPTPFDGKAVILWTDGSVRSLPIDRASGEVMLDGDSLFDPGHSVWSGKAPLILLPE